MGYFEARRARLIRNQTALLKLSNDVVAQDQLVEVYIHHDEMKLVESVTFFRGEEINTVSFHEVPYRWSGCGHGELNNSNYTLDMPFTVKDVLDKFHPVTGIKQRQPDEFFKSKEQYLKWYSFLKRYNIPHEVR